MEGISLYHRSVGIHPDRELRSGRKELFIMKINQVEQAVGISKKNIRFYESQGILHPSRNLENGYRDYAESDILTLFQIKLLRKLSIPIEEIRKMQENHLSLSDCMTRHIIYLNHEEKNIILMKEICETLSQNEESLHTLDALDYLKKMEELEKGGTRFMNIQKEDHRKKKSGPIIAAAVMILLMAGLIALFVWFRSVDPIPIGLLLFFIAMPAAVIIGVLLALRERFKEIEGGEEHEASKY